jgi:spore coat polysaccharide biosynthesis protein SpsF (cytidylyltransferase family)
LPATLGKQKKGSQRLPRKSIKNILKNLLIKRRTAT